MQACSLCMHCGCTHAHVFCMAYYKYEPDVFHDAEQQAYYVYMYIGLNTEILQQLFVMMLTRCLVAMKY